ncbi:MAG: pilus assembly protein TadB [Planctomycetota bacterium]|nr:MAG: pilus assembly protein TadB [Planctomycetota bacterium]
MASDLITPQPEFAGILREQETFARDDSNDMGNRINSWFDLLMIQSGIGLAPSMVLALCLCSALTLAGVAFVWQEDLLIAAISGLLGFVAPIVVATMMRARRQSVMMNQMPPMIDELARAAKTGRSLEACLQVVANDTPVPLGGELRRCTDRIALGLPLSAALDELPVRTGLVSASVLATALSVHRETGGDLVHVLERLATTIRDRIQFQGRLAAATAASRAVAILMIALPPGILAFFLFRDPNYIDSLTASTWASRLTFLAIVLQIIGSIWVMRILANSKKT